MKKSFPSLRAIVVSKELLEDIEAAVSRRLGSSDYTVEYICSSKGSPNRCYTSLKDLEKCDNSLERSIESLTMEVSSGEDFRLWVAFGKAQLEDLEEEYHGIHLPTPVNTRGAIQGSQKWIDELWTDVNYQIRRYSCSNLYSFLSYAGVLFTAMLTMILARVLMHCYGLPETYSVPIMGIVNKPFDPTSFWGEFIPYALVYFYALVVALYLRKPIKRLFPRVRFILGDNQDAERRRRTLIDRIIWDIIITLLIGIAGAIIYDLLNTLNSNFIL